MTSNGKSYIQKAMSELTPGEREAAYQLALSDGDRRRAGEIALAPIPDGWPEHEQAIWRGRQAVARQREHEVDELSGRARC